jgi:hypothetical protein
MWRAGFAVFGGHLTPLKPLLKISGRFRTANHRGAMLRHRRAVSSLFPCSLAIADRALPTQRLRDLLRCDDANHAAAHDHAPVAACVLLDDAREDTPS